ncbi:glycerate kinase [Rhodospirillum rubrum]|uniref:glycerate kinase type-2 family protein n=1 Tax=Rhodospirillum rubrum TaxID=1085 RepID=UPI001904C9B2|nr:glycerate kinase [Rhodospirillum rubrum]MBK1665065.1 glycerate kinase [Rhodospirillum rubrum]MBK1677019.1 glycerate kinase [Rhodospirillum rubrum]
MTEPIPFLRALFDAAVAAAAPALLVPAHLPEPPRGRTVVVGAGKGAAAMALAVESAWTGPLDGLVVTRYGHGVPCARIKVVEAGHPVPDEHGQWAAREILTLAQGLTEDDLLICLISGGGSALLSLPPDTVGLADKRAVTTALLRCGAPISAINTVRKHLSTIKGGRLAAAAAPARVVTLIISDVPGDDPAVIASGPTVPDPTTAGDALAILAAYGISEPASALAHLKTPAAETPKPGDAAFTRTSTHLIATPRMALTAAADFARAAGITPVILGDTLEGEARDAALLLGPMALSCARHGEPAMPPCVLLSGGEFTVTLRGDGRGGPNGEFALALARRLDSHPHIWAMACDTDGIDGSEDNAGALITPDTLVRAARLGLSADAHLADNDSYGFFQALGDLVMTGPTLTNVNDFRAILISAE